MIVVAGFGSIGSFLYFLLYQKGYRPLIYSRRKNLKPYSVYFLASQKEEYTIQDINIHENCKRIKYLFLCTKANESVNYLREILNSFKVDNLVLTQNGIGLEDEALRVFNGNLYYLTLTAGMEFNDNKLVIFNPKKSEIVLTKVREDEKIYKWDLDLGFKYVFFRVFDNHLSVRFSKLILNLILNVVPVAFGGLPWEVFPKNEEAVKFEKNLIKEVYFLVKSLKIPFFDFRGYSTKMIS
ncbi:MAG: 2-dehydropantoate 2-reductase N-terminal domain-containing protein, partial [bacterium]